MVNLFYDFKALEKKLGWDNDDGLHYERNQKFNNLIRTFKIQEKIEKMRVFSKDGVNIRSDDIKGFKDIYLEVNHKELTVGVRHLTYSKEEYVKHLGEVAEGVLMAKHSLIVDDSPCNRCGKQVYSGGYDGICMDCSDELGVSELFMSNKNYESNLEKAKVFLNSFQRKVGSISFLVLNPELLNTINGLESDGLVIKTKDKIKLTEKGRKKADEVKRLIDGGKK